MFKIDKNKAYRPNACHYLYIKSKKINYMFLRHCPRHVQYPRINNFYCVCSIHIGNGTTSTQRLFVCTGNNKSGKLFLRRTYFYMV